jgi:hypothetical protein
MVQFSRILVGDMFSSVGNQKEAMGWFPGLAHGLLLFSVFPFISLLTKICL